MNSLGQLPLPYTPKNPELTAQEIAAHVSNLRNQAVQGQMMHQKMLQSAQLHPLQMQQIQAQMAAQQQKQQLAEQEAQEAAKLNQQKIQAMQFQAEHPGLAMRGPAGQMALGRYYDELARKNAANGEVPSQMPTSSQNVGNEDLSDPAQLSAAYNQFIQNQTSSTQKRAEAQLVRNLSPYQRAFLFSMWGPEAYHKFSNYDSLSPSDQAIMKLGLSQAYKQQLTPAALRTALRKEGAAQGTIQSAQQELSNLQKAGIGSGLSSVAQLAAEKGRTAFGDNSEAFNTYKKLNQDVTVLLEQVLSAMNLPRTNESINELKKIVNVDLKTNSYQGLREQLANLSSLLNHTSNNLRVPAISSPALAEGQEMQAPQEPSSMGAQVPLVHTSTTQSQKTPLNIPQFKNKDEFLKWYSSLSADQRQAVNKGGV